MKIKENKHRDGCSVDKEYVLCPENDGERAMIESLAHPRPTRGALWVTQKETGELVLRIINMDGGASHELAGVMFVPQAGNRSVH